jgi:PLP dependent protein
VNLPVLCGLDLMTVAENIEGVRERIAAAAGRASRRPEEITLMAVTKTLAPERIREAYAAGIRVFGENRVQEFAGKAGAVRDLAGAEWHMIGHLQSNKASKAAELFSAVDSVDSLKLAERLNVVAEKLNKKLTVLIEINVAGEEAKTGVAPEAAELQAILDAAPDLFSVTIRGLMTIPPFTEDPEQSRPFFRRVRDLTDRIAAQKYPAVSMDVLSMGMSQDFGVAIEEGSTCVRVGTAVFGERTKA